MRITKPALLLTLLLPFSGPAYGQEAENEVELEGTIENIVCVEPGADQWKYCTRAEMTLLGTKVYVDKTTPIITPTADLTGKLDLLLSEEAMHGSKYKGFPESSAIVTGVSDGEGRVIPDNIWVDIKENVVLGQLQKNNQRTKEFIVQGTRIVLVPATGTAASMPRELATFDPRMPGMPLVNDYGIRIKPATIPVGTLISAEGYYDESEGLFYAWLLEVSGGTPVREDISQVSILRAQCRVRDVNEIELEVMGGSFLPADATIRIFAPAGRATQANGTPTTRMTQYGVVTAEADADNPEFGLYDLDTRQAPPTGTTGCPTGIRAEMVNPPNPLPTGNGRVLSPGIFSVDVR